MVRRMRMLWAGVIGLALLAATPARAGLEALSFTLEGHERKLVIYTPDGLSAPAPLVLVLHGLTQGIATIRRQSREHFEMLADTHGFIVAYPEALYGAWNIGPAYGGDTVKPRRDDLAYIDAVISVVSGRQAVDRGRIYAAGFSQGAQVAMLYACTRPGRLRALASFSMNLPTDMAATCAAHPPRGVLLVHGTLDQVVPFEGGPEPMGFGKRIDLYSHPETARAFAGMLGCSGPGPQVVLDELGDGTVAIGREWTGCGPTPVEDWVLEGAGHSWPGGGFDLPLTNRKSREVDGAALSWRFFSRLR